MKRLKRCKTCGKGLMVEKALLNSTCWELSTSTYWECIECGESNAPRVNQVPKTILWLDSSNLLPGLSPEIIPGFFDFTVPIEEVAVADQIFYTAPNKQIHEIEIKL